MILLNENFLSASSHFYKRSCPSVGWLVCWLVGNAIVWNAQNGWFWRISSFLPPYMPYHIHFHSLIHSFIHSFILSFVHSFIHSIIHSFIQVIQTITWPLRSHGSLIAWPQDWTGLTDGRISFSFTVELGWIATSLLLMFFSAWLYVEIKAM